MTSSETSLTETGAHTVGTRVWVADPAEGWVKAEVVEVLPNEVAIKLQTGQARKCKATDLPLQNPGKYGVEVRGNRPLLRDRGPSKCVQLLVRSLLPCRAVLAPQMFAGHDDAFLLERTNCAVESTHAL